METLRFVLGWICVYLMAGLGVFKPIIHSVIRVKTVAEVDLICG